MSFSATILFSPPSGGSDTKCCGCACKSENNEAPSGGAGSAIPTPISVSGQGLAVQSSEQLLHLIYQRVEKAVSVAEAALGVARSNCELLTRLQDEVGELRKRKHHGDDAEPMAGAAAAGPPPPPPPQQPLPAENALVAGQVRLASEACKVAEEEPEGLGSVQVVIEELRQLGAASAASVPTHLAYPTDRVPREVRLAGCPAPSEVPPLLNPVADDYITPDGSLQRLLIPAFAKQLSAAAPLAVHRAAVDGVGVESGFLPGVKQQLQREESLSPGAMVIDSSGEASASCSDRRSSSSPPPLLPLPPPLLLYTGSSCKARGSGQKNSRRKRDLVLSKLVHSVHNHISNSKRFNGSESIKSSWNISVVKFLVEKLKQELVSSIHQYTDKELKGACVAYFLTKRREYRNSMNPFKSLKEKEEKKLRSRRYRLFANRSSVIHHFPPEQQRLWKDVTEELMSDEEDSLNEPGVWVARPPRFRSRELTELCYHIDANSKHGTKANRVYGPPSERLPSAEAQLLPLHVYNPNFQEEEEEEEEEEEGSVEQDPRYTQGLKAFCPGLNSFIEVKVEKDE
ncbi:uncharacterized protein C14orf93 homolog [Rhinatrema bivittatum]|uniref:uncharacterized protein C14orf93 homolog n=1 Tax=Rhinatrema bivittatum TaxID=194408 RepID=UPI001128D9F5|nr:uncharacterized protein C14orf93 homolog [Rhinatrema bivittatum]